MTICRDTRAASGPMTTDPANARLSYLLLSLTTLFWSGNVLLGRYFHDLLPPLALNFWRWVAAAAILAPFALRPLIEQRTIVLRHWKLLAILGALGVTGFNSMSYTALHSTTAINVALINSLMPIMVVVLSWLGFRETIGARQGIGIALSLAGALTIVAHGEIGALLALRFAPGDVMMIVAVLLYSAYSVLLRLKPPALGGIALLGAIVGFGLVLSLPLLAIETVTVGPLPLTVESLGVVVYVGLFPSVLAYVFWNKGVATIGANRASLFIHLLPTFTAILAILFLGESLHLYHLAGIALIFGGLVLATRPRRANL